MPCRWHTPPVSGTFRTLKSLETYRQTFEPVKKRHRRSNGNAVPAACCVA